MSSSVSNEFGLGTSTAYQREQAEKDAVNSGKVTHNDFLKLLTKQLTTQDPLNPMQDIDFTGQLAQLQALDEQMAMTKTMQSMRIDTQLQAGTAMIGKYISGTDATGAGATGLVTRVAQNSDGVFVELANKQQVEIGSVNNVWNDADGMLGSISNSGNVIGKWIEAGYDEAAQPIRGIVESVNFVNGQVQLKLYGGQSVTWSQVTSLREPTEDELWYTLPDEIREKVEKAQKMVKKLATGQDKDGNTRTGVVSGAVLDGSKVYLTLFNGERIDVDTITSDPRDPDAGEAYAGIGGFWVEGLSKGGEDVAGIVVGAVDNEDGLALILDTGERVYWDTVDVIREAKDEDRNHIHGLWAEGVTLDGEDVAGVIVEKVEVGGKLAVKLDTGMVILCENIASLRTASDEEKGRLE